MKCLTIFYLLITTLSTPALAEKLSHSQWKKMELPHFDLIYAAHHQELANLYSTRLENAHSLLQPHFLEAPERTIVVINDKTDLTNGYAVSVPYPMMVLFPVYPGSEETVGEYGDWEFELAIHEYTHILSMHPKRGVMRVLHSIFGSIIAPNMYMPRWWLEGIAVDSETRFSQFGRLRSPLQDASIRALVRENQLASTSIAEINDVENPVWPYGGRPYLFGSLIWSEMITLGSPRSVSLLHQRQSGRIPYFINQPAEDFFQLNYTDLFDEVKNQITHRANEQLIQLREKATTESEPLQLPGIEQLAPTISPDGLMMAYIEKADSTRRSIRILTRKNQSEDFQKDHLKKTKTETDVETSYTTGPQWPDGPPTGSIRRISWLPNSRQLVFDKVKEIHRAKEASDLYIFDLKNGKTTPLSSGLRAREPDTSKDGKHIAYVGLDAGASHLAVMNLENKKIHVVYRPKIQTRISWPVFLNNQEVLFCERSAGQERLMKINIRSKQLSTVKVPFKGIQNIYLNNDKLYFTSTANGVRNIYFGSLPDQKYQPISHSETGIAGYAIDSWSQKAYVSELSSKGFRIGKMKIQSLDPLPEVQPLLSDRYPAVTPQLGSTSTPPAQDYSGLKYLWPTYWLPLFATDSKGTYFSVQTSGSDPLGKMGYNLYALYNSYVNKISYDIQLYYDLLDPLLDFRTKKTYSYLATSSQTTESELNSIQSTWQLLALSPDWFWTFQVAQTKNQNSFSTTPSQQMGPGLGINYSSIGKAGKEISPESGRVFNLNGIFNARLENYDDFNRFNLNYAEYFSRWLPTHHAIMARLQGSWVDRPISTNNFISTNPYDLARDVNVTSFAVRGYPSGTFFAKSLAVGTFEYRFPLYNFYSGIKTTPLFFRRLHAAIIADAIACDGFAFNEPLSSYVRTHSNQSYGGSGLELHLDTTIGYHIPLSIFYGFYWPMEKQFSGNSPYIVLGVTL